MRSCPKITQRYEQIFLALQEISSRTTGTKQQDSKVESKRVHVHIYNGELTRVLLQSSLW